jgi:hypothetical protein
MLEGRSARDAFAGSGSGSTAAGKPRLAQALAANAHAKALARTGAEGRDEACVG